MLASDLARGSWERIEQDVHAALNGQAAERLRALVPRETRREEGAYFTSGGIRDRFGALVRRAVDSSGHHGPFWDPTCGAGDLLLSASETLPLRPTLSKTLQAWGALLRGHDTQAEFVEVARLRLFIAAAARHRAQGSRIGTSAAKGIEAFRHVLAGDGLEALRRSIGDFKGHVLLNPPFGAVEAETGCHWTTGVTSQASIFFIAGIESLTDRSPITAVLPDVLRSGSRYKPWRSSVDSNLIIEEVSIFGQFDRYTDVDVFLIQGRRKLPSDAEQLAAPWWPELTSNRRVEDIFEVRVGPVVDNRDPHDGPLTLFLTARDLPPNGATELPTRKRNFTGRLFEPPFVVIRRTSRPGPGSYGMSRAAGVIVAGNRKVAVDNHLIVARPKDNSIATCESLLRVLESSHVVNWLDQRIRCRHMTVGVIRSIPWRE